MVTTFISTVSLFSFYERKVQVGFTPRPEQRQIVSDQLNLNVLSLRIRFAYADQLLSSVILFVKNIYVAILRGCVRRLSINKRNEIKLISCTERACLIQTFKLL